MTINRRLLAWGLAAVALAQYPARAHDEDGKVAAGQVAYHYVGRVSLNFQTGRGVVFGYLTTLHGLPGGAALFNGIPSESTAYFTFRADVSFQPLMPNGDLGGGAAAIVPVLIAPGEFKMYFSANPSRTWSDPQGFSNGRLIANLSRELEQLALIGPISTNTATALLESSPRFVFNGREVDLGRIIANGVTNVTTGNNAPLPGSTAA